jgi:hypothetical protein
MSVMRPRRTAAWLLSLPLMVVGTQVAHVLAYDLVYPSAHVRLSALLASGHGYMVGTHGYLPMLLGIAGALDLVAVGWVFAGSLRRSLQRPVPAWTFALLPLLCYALQELIERWLAGSSVPWWMVLQPTFRVGLALQLPFALAAFLLARVLLRAGATAAGRVRAHAPRPSDRSPLPTSWLVPPITRVAGIATFTLRPARGPPAAGAAATALST